MIWWKAKHNASEYKVHTASSRQPDRMWSGLMRLLFWIFLRFIAVGHNNILDILYPEYCHSPGISTRYHSTFTYITFNKILLDQCVKVSHIRAHVLVSRNNKRWQYTEEGQSGTRTFWGSDYSEIELKLYKSSLCRVIWVKMDDLHYQPNHLIQYANEKSIITWNLGLHILCSLQKLWYKVSANITLDEVGLDWNWEKKSITLDTQYHVSRMTRFLQIPKWVMGSCAHQWVHSNPCSTCRYSILLSPESLIQIMYLFNLLCQ